MLEREKYMSEVRQGFLWDWPSPTNEAMKIVTAIASPVVPHDSGGFRILLVVCPWSVDTDQ